MLVDTGELEVPGSEVHRSESEVLRGEGTIVIVTPGLSATYHVPASWSLRRRMPCVCGGGGGGVPVILSLYPQKLGEQVRHTFRSIHFGRV